jgi:hypothetical protein
MTQANQADLFGEGTLPGVRRPNDPNDLPNPNNPGGMSNNELRRLQLASGVPTRSGYSGRASGGAPLDWAQDPGTTKQQTADARAANQPKDKNFFEQAAGLVSSFYNNPVVNPIGYAAGKAGGAVNRAVGADVSGYIQDPLGQGLKDAGAPDAVQVAANPTGYLTRNAVNAGTGYGTNPGAIAQNAISSSNNLRNDARNTATAVRNAPSAIAGAVGGYGGGGSSGGGTIGGTPIYQQSAQSGSALSSEAQRILSQAGQFANQNQAQANTFYGQAAAAGQRAAPQMARPSSGQMDAVYDRAMSFNAQSGSDAIRAAQADVSGAGRLENYQLDQQGINNLEGFRSENSAAGVDALNNFNPRRTLASADQLSNFDSTHTLDAANKILTYNPHASIYQDVENLRNFQADRSGIDRLNEYADAPEGPSQAQALLRLQSDADKRTALALARSGRGSPADVARAQRQAITEGAAIAGETRGQASALRAQETDMYKQRQLAALAQAGSLISQAEAQRLQGLAQAGSLMSQADQQKLQALQAYGALKAQIDTNQLSAYQSAGQLNAAGEGMKLSSTQSAAALQGQMDQQRLSAINAAAGYRTQGDAIQSQNLQSAGQIRLAGSEINQRGAIAASNADLQAQALNLQSLSLAGNISTAIRSQDIDVLKSNLSAELQTLGLNDQQVRFFSQMASDREVASQNLQMQANALGLNATQAQEALNLQWSQFGFQQLTTQQQAQYQQQVFNATNARANRQEIAGYAGAGFSALSSLFSGGGGGAVASGGGGGYLPPLPQVPNMQLTMPSYSYQNVGTNNAAAGSPSMQLTMPTYQPPYQPTAPTIQY